MSVSLSPVLLAQMVHLGELATEITLMAILQFKNLLLLPMRTMRDSLKEAVLSELTAGNEIQFSWRETVRV